MAKIDPIMAVKDVNISSEWYQSVFGCKRTHGGDNFAVLVDENDEILICLHKWENTYEHALELGWLMVKYQLSY